MPSILITGSNRGLGLEWVREYAAQGWRIHAACRQPEGANSLHALAESNPNVSVHGLDVTRPEQIATLQRELAGEPLDILLNNAGVYFEQWGKDKLGQINYADWQATFAVNTLGAVRLSEALLDNIAASRRKLIVAISSHMGSIADITSGNDYAYRSSKAALNAAMKGLSYEVRARGIGVLLLHPGWVRTRMGGNSAPLAPVDSVTGMRAVVDGFHAEQSGRFFRYDGSEIPW